MSTVILLRVKFFVITEVTSGSNKPRYQNQDAHDEYNHARGRQLKL